MLAFVFEYYSAGQNSMVMYDINHIQRITLRGGYIESFHHMLVDGHERVINSSRSNDLATVLLLPTTVFQAIG